MTTSRPCSASAPPRRLKPSRVAVVVLVAAIASGLPAVADTSARDAALCALLGTSARDALSLGYEAAAIELLDEALGFVPSNPDANYLRALLGLSRGESLALSATRLESALVGGTFLLYQPNDARLLYAAVLAKTHKPDQALRLIADLPVSAEVLYVETLARLALGDDEGAGKSVIASLKRYPVDPRPLLAWLNSRDRPVLTRSGRSVVDTGMSALEKLKEADPSILLALAPYLGSVDQARLLVREFRAMGGTGAAATVLALRYGLIMEDRAVREMLSGSFNPTSESVTTLYGLLSSDSSRSAFATAFSAYSGMMIQDSDRDGLPEAVTTYAGGQPGLWSLDENQDGVSEVQVEFTASVPTALKTRRGSTNMAVRYDTWPYAGELEFSDDTGSRRYSLGPAVMPLPLVNLISIPGVPGGPYLVERGMAALPTEKSAGMQAYAVHTAALGSAAMEVYDGEPVRSWWTDAQQRSGYTVYSKGFPVDESIDGDNDGRHESRRVWGRAAGGLPAVEYLESDLDGDGLYEYRETQSRDGTTLQAWDYDGNGSFDLTRGQGIDGSIVYRYFGVSGRVTEAVYRNARLDGVMENGRPVPLVVDSGAVVTWIGAKPFDFGKEIPPEGRGSRNGSMYTVFSIADVLYAQVLD